MTIRLSDSSFAPLIPINMNINWYSLIVLSEKTFNMGNYSIWYVKNLDIWLNFNMNQITTIQLKEVPGVQRFKDKRYIVNQLHKLKEDYSLNLSLEGLL